METTPGGRQLSILLVDDDDNVRWLAALLVEQLGHRVVVAADGGEALARFAEEAFDAVLLDYEMPLVNGPQTAARIRERERERGAAEGIPLFMMTGHKDEGRLALCYEAGADGVIVKPLDRDRMALLLEGVEQLAGLRPELAGGDEVDLSIIKEIIGDDRAGQQAFFAQYLTNVRAGIDRLACHLADGDRREAQAAAHTVKGSLRQAGAEGAARVAHLMELAPGLASRRPAPLLDLLRRRFAGVERAMEKEQA